MGYYVSNMFGIRTGGVFSGPVDMADMRSRISALVRKMRAEEIADAACMARRPDLGDENGDPSHCMSQELEAHKGSYVVLAGVFNYWTYDESSVFAKRLSAELGTEVMHMCWNEETGQVDCCVWDNGEAMNGPPGLADTLRRVT